MNNQLLIQAAIPRNHWDCRISEIPDTCEYKSFIIDYCADIKNNILGAKGLYLWGDYGTGKTGLAAIIAKAALSKGLMSLWISAEKIPSYICDDIYFSDELLMRDRMFSVPLLVIDDLRLRDQTNVKNDWIERWLESVIRRRMDNTLTTVISSNDSEFALRKLKSVYSITSEACRFLEIKGKNFRKDLVEDRDEE